MRQAQVDTMMESLILVNRMFLAHTVSVGTMSEGSYAKGHSLATRHSAISTISRKRGYSETSLEKDYSFGSYRMPGTNRRY